MKRLGFWREDAFGLPSFEYTGALPYRACLPGGKPVKLPEDPWFLLGNYRLTLFAHVSGAYELISGQRSWARLNQGAAHNSGVNSATITIDGARFHLTGMDSSAADPAACRRVFGCGFADYVCSVGPLAVRRNLSVKPSWTPYDGASGFLLSVSIVNRGDHPVECEYEESMGVRFVEIHRQDEAEANLPLKYEYDFHEGASAANAWVTITAVSDDPLRVPEREAMATFDGYPPTVFMGALSEGVRVSGDRERLAARASFTLRPGEERWMQCVVGFSFAEGVSTREGILHDLSKGGFPEAGSGAFSADWSKVLPTLDGEEDATLRRELRWHAYTLEAMATYSEYYGEAKIPQGTIYDYDWGVHASARDNFQHALPLVYTNPPLARSVLRYMLERTTPFGEIRLIEYGNGYADNERYFTSDQQLYCLLLLSEYLRVTGDYGFLAEGVRPYPVRGMKEMAVAELTERCFIFLRDTVGVGSHGLVRLLNSDWNDAVYYIEKVPYNNVVLTGESHMNSAMAIAILQSLIPELKKAEACLPEQADRLERLRVSMGLYRQRVLEAFLKDWGDRAFPRRMYFNGRAYGEENMFLEPQGFALQIEELSEDAKLRLYREMKARLYDGETLGAREQQQPEFDDPEFDRGSRENGGFWWALNGPVILGVSTFDGREADRLLRNMTLGHLAEAFPQYWSSYWSAADQVESSLIPEVGLPDQSLAYANIPVFCAHPHAWILYCWYRLREK